MVVAGLLTGGASGPLSWGLALAGRQNAGEVIAWAGMAIYAAFAPGAPAGTALYAGRGFVAIALATTLAPPLALPS